MAVMKNAEGYPDPTAGAAIRNVTNPKIGHIYTTNAGIYALPLKVLDKGTIAYKLDSSVPYTSEYVINVDNYVCDTRKIINLTTNRYEDDLGPVSEEEMAKIWEAFTDVCGVELKTITDDGSAEIAHLKEENELLREEVRKYRHLYDKARADLVKKEGECDEAAREFNERLMGFSPTSGEGTVEFQYDPALIRVEAERDTYKSMYREMMRMLFMVEDTEC